MWVRKIPFILLLLLTIFAVFVTSFAFSSDPEAKLSGAGIGGCLLFFAAPFWMIYRGKIHFSAGLALIGLLCAGIIYLNCWAAMQAGTIYTHPGDNYEVAVCLVPGLITAFAHWAIKWRRSA